MNRTQVCLLYFVVFFAGAGLMFAHHGLVEYEMNKSVTVVGTVTKFEWTNPHCILSVEVKGDRDKVEEWNAEFIPPNQMTRAGWNRQSIKAGDQITMIGHPGKKGVPIMWLQHLVLSDGRKLDRETEVR